MTYFVGIDIAKFKHDCFIMNENGEVIRESFSFDNNRLGFEELLNVLKPLKPQVKIGFESTGHYATNLKMFLEEKGFSYMELQPLLVKRFIQATTLRRTKTDKVDASLISLYLSSVEYKPYLNKSYHIERLKSLCRSRHKLVEERSLQLTRITNCLDLMFPEFKPFFNGKLNASTPLYILENYPSVEKIIHMNLESYNKMKAKLHRTISYARFLELKKLAKETIGNQDEILQFQLITYLGLFKELNTKILEIESFIEKDYSSVHSHIASIPGIGTLSAAMIFSEIGNINRFSNYNQILAYAGLEPSTIQSGQADHKGRMVKHGSSHLRYALMNVSEYSLVHNPKLYDYYLKKRSEGKAHRVALSHVAKKLVRIIYHLETNDVDFDANQMK